MGNHTTYEQKYPGMKSSKMTDPMGNSDLDMMSGNMTVQSSTTYTYDAAGQMISMTA